MTRLQMENGELKSGTISKMHQTGQESFSDVCQELFQRHFSLSFCTCCHCNHNLHFFRLWNVFNFQLVQVVQSVFTFIQFTSHYIPTTRRMTSPYGPPILTWLHSHWWTTWPHVQKDAVKVASWIPPQLIKHDKVPSRLSFQWTKCGESPSLLNKCIMTLFTLERLAYLRCSFCRPCP